MQNGNYCHFLIVLLEESFCFVVWALAVAIMVSLCSPRLQASLVAGRNLDVRGWWLVFLHCFQSGVPAPVGGSFAWWDLPSPRHASPPNSADMESLDNFHGFLLVLSFKNLSYSKQKIHHIRSPKERCIFKRHLKMVFF